MRPLPSLPRIFTAVLCLAAASTVQAQRDDSLDAAFNPSFDNYVQSLAQQGDGKLLVGTSFVGNAPVPVTRLNSDGSVDAGFNAAVSSTGTNPQTELRAFAVQSDGKIVVAGRFNYVNGAAHNCLARLNADGTVDPSFNASADFEVYQAFLLPGGKLLVAGDWTKFKGVATSGKLLRLNADGSVDATFSADIPRPPDSVSLQGDGKIVVANDVIVNNNSVYQLTRLNADGSKDASFTIATLNDYAYATAVQTDGKILLGGPFTQVNGATHRGLARLNSDGTLDTAFNPALEDPQSNDAGTFSIVPQADGKILAGGFFALANGTPRNNLARFFADGSLDNNFAADVSTPVNRLLIQGDYKLLLGGGFTQVNGVAHNRLARLSGGQRPALLANSVPLANGVNYLRFVNGSKNLFGYYAYLADSHYIYHFDLGYEYVFDANDGARGAYLYDFTSNTFFYTSPGFGFPYLYDFSLNAVLYYYPDPTRPDHYNTDGVRYFYNFKTGQIITK